MTSPFARVLTLSAVLLALGAPPAGASDDPSDLERLVGMLTGSFDSGAQAAADTNFHSIDLHMVPIWPEATDGRWLYVEQSLSSRPESPYRQRLYRIDQLDDGVLRSRVYTFESEDDYVGAWKQPSRFDDLDREEVHLREGCAVYLREEAGGFVGSTRGEQCSSDMHGATHATSEVRIEPGRVESLDRGFDEEGELAWGSEFGPYVFVRQDEE